MTYHPRRSVRRRQDQREKGITLLEVLVVVALIGILAAIAIPFWAKFVANRRVNAAQDELRQGILIAQNAAITNRSSWRFSLRQVNDRLEWAVHPEEVDWKSVGVWNALSPHIILYLPDTTMASKEGTYYVRFGFQGDVSHRLSTLTVDSKNGIAQNKCVVISTLIGATRKGEEHLYPNGDRYCY